MQVVLSARSPLPEPVEAVDVDTGQPGPSRGNGEIWIHDAHRGVEPAQVNRRQIEHRADRGDRSERLPIGQREPECSPFTDEVALHSAPAELDADSVRFGGGAESE